MNVLLNDNEVRVLGALVEKESTTPDYYPLSLNALTNACNQKSNRDPVMSLSEGEVTEALEGLRDKGLARQVSSFDSRVPKYAHQLAGEVEAWEPPPPVRDAPAEDERVRRLEAEVEEIRREVADLTQQLNEFRKQFE